MLRWRRVLSWWVDVALLGAPWASFFGLFLLSSPRSGIGGLGYVLALCVAGALGDILLLVVQTTLWLRYGRTVGMAYLGVSRRAGSAWLAPLFKFGFVALLALAGWFVRGNEGDPEPSVIIGLPLGAMLLDLAFAFFGGAGTLTDRLAGIRFALDAPARQAMRSRGSLIDVALFVIVGAPLVSVLAFRELAGAALAGAFNVALLAAVELNCWSRTGFTLGARAMLDRAEC